MGDMIQPGGGLPWGKDAHMDLGAIRWDKVHQSMKGGGFGMAGGPECEDQQAEVTWCWYIPLRSEIVEEL